jgi:3-oxoacyl-[acyl-carrier-protein] synthase-3
MGGQINQSAGADHAAILGLGAYRPRRIVPNAEILEQIDSSDEWIQTRSGIKERRWADPDETILMMSSNAAKDALAESGIDPAQIGCVIVATVTHLYQTPAIATQLAVADGRRVRRLGRLRRVLLRRRDGQRPRPRRQREVRAGDRGGAAQ